jgi:hypothetical protein
MAWPGLGSDLRGLLNQFRSPTDSRAGRKDARMMQTEWRRESLSIAKELKAHAEARGMTPSQLAVAWVLNNRLVTSVICGHGGATVGLSQGAGRSLDGGERRAGELSGCCWPSIDAGLCRSDGACGRARAGLKLGGIRERPSAGGTHN